MKKLILTVIMVSLGATVGFTQEAREVRSSDVRPTEVREQKANDKLTAEEKRILKNFTQEFPGAAKKYDRNQLIRFVKNEKTKQRMVYALQHNNDENGDGLTKNERRERMENYLESRRENAQESREEFNRKKQARIEEFRKNNPDATKKEARQAVKERKQERKEERVEKFRENPVRAKAISNNQNNSR